MNEVQERPGNHIGLDGVELGHILEKAEGNTGDFRQRFPTVWALLEDTHRAYARLWEITEHDDREDRILARMFMIRTHAALCAAVRLATGGQFNETFPILRVAIELAWYALHIAKDPEGTRRASVWLRRNESRETLELCKSEFMVANVRATHEKHDAATAGQLEALYKTMIDYGAHPNQLGMLAGLDRADSFGQTTLLVPLLRVAELPMVLATRMVVAVAVGGLHVFRLIYPERVQISDFRRKIDALGDELNSVFKPFIEKASPETTSPSA